MKEQIAVHTLRAHRPSARHHVGTSYGLQPEDCPAQTTERRPMNRQPIHGDEDDALYETRLPTSTRRYTPAPSRTPPRTVMRVTHHEGPPPPQRASRYAPMTEEQPIQTRAALPTRQRFHWSVYLGLAMLCMLVGWIGLTTLLHWWQVQRDTWTYGMPRTFQVDADVRHGGISHFTVENLNGHILIYEVVMNDISKPHLYLGPIFSGAGTELQPATVSFADLNGDGYPDMVILVGNGRYLMINDHSAFRQVNASDHISGKGV